jgi:rubrerythrin
MRREIGIGKNRTGLEASPLERSKVVEGATLMPPTTQGDESAIAAVLGDHARVAEPVGSLHAPIDLKGAVNLVEGSLRGRPMAVFLDKLGERLAYERAGTRLYQALLAKYDALGAFDGGPTRDEILRIHEDELRHFGLLLDAIRSLGGDPTAATPSADIQAIASSGLVHVLHDPRTSAAECLDAIVIAELVDNDAWGTLVDLAGRLGRAEMAAEFEEARETEADHLRRVRRWASASLTRRMAS